MSAPEVDKRLALVDALSDAERRALLMYLACRPLGARLVDEWFLDREADSGGQRYDAWGWSSSGPGAVPVGGPGRSAPPGVPVVDELAAAREDRARG